MKQNIIGNYHKPKCERSKQYDEVYQLIEGVSGKRRKLLRS